MTGELFADISRIFNLLKESGADMDYIAPNSFGKTYIEQYGDEPLAVFLKKN